MLYCFTSSKSSENVRLTIWTNSPKRALGYAVINFVKNGYKGSPIRVL